MGNGGESDSGSIFRVNTDGTGYTVLKRFPPTYSNPNDLTNLDAC